MYTRWCVPIDEHETRQFYITAFWPGSERTRRFTEKVRWPITFRFINHRNFGMQDADFLANTRYDRIERFSQFDVETVAWRRFSPHGAVRPPRPDPQGGARRRVRRCWDAESANGTRGPSPLPTMDYESRARDAGVDLDMELTSVGSYEFAFRRRPAHRRRLDRLGGRPRRIRAGWATISMSLSASRPHVEPAGRPRFRPPDPRFTEPRCRPRAPDGLRQERAGLRQPAAGDERRQRPHVGGVRDAGRHARSAIGLPELPLGASVRSTASSTSPGSSGSYTIFRS